MPSTPPYPPRIALEPRRPPGLPGRYQSAPELYYNLDKCINCGYRYEYDKSVNEQVGDVTMPWRHFSSIVTDHYSSCPRKFANISPPTSAIRDTLSQSNVQRRSALERSMSISRHLPYPLPFSSRPEFPVGVEPRRRAARSASPEPSYESSRQATPEQVELSRRAAEPARTTPSKNTLKLSDPVDEPIQSPSTMVVSDNLGSLPPFETFDQSPPSIEPPPAMVTEPASKFSSDSTLVLPPIWNRKRKLSRLQDVTRADTLTGESLVNVTPSPEPGTPSTPLPPVVSPTSTFVHDADGTCERVPKRVKKNVMDPSIRENMLRADPLIQIVQEKEVFCRPCQKWIKLDKRNRWYPGLWNKHRRTMHERLPPEPQLKRKLHDEADDGGSFIIERQPTKRRKTTRKSRVQRQTQPRVEDAKATATRSIRSPSRVTRSFSVASN